MATFIPEKLRVGAAAAIHIKRVLNQLDAQYVVRTPLQTQATQAQPGVPDFFIQHADKGWLGLTVSDIPYEALAEATLLGNDARRQAFETQLAQLQAWSRHGMESGQTPLRILVLLWKCSSAQTQRIAAQWQRDDDQGNLRFLSRDAFKAGGADLVARQLQPIGAQQVQSLLRTHFPEAQIHTGVPQRLLRRDNSATLATYFLDYDQEWVAKLDLTPTQEQAQTSADMTLRLINGVAGSGKTLIALARARLLAQLHPQQHVLLLIHNRPVVSDVQMRLKKAGLPLLPNLEINTFFAWASGQWRRLYGRRPVLVGGLDALASIARCRSVCPELSYTPAQLLSEIDFINENLLQTEGDYLSASRVGRGFALREKERKAIWQLHAAVTAELASRQPAAMLWSALPRALCLAEQCTLMRRADHVLIDEAQFFAPAWLQTVRLGMQPGGSLFLCADPNQGFMKNRLSWKSVGLDVVGRTKKLHRAYRMSGPILATASRVLQQHTQGNAEDYLQPDMAHMPPGPAPHLLMCDSMQDAIERLVNEIAQLHHNASVSLGDILVLYGGRLRSARALYEKLSKRLGRQAVWWFDLHKYAPPSPDKPCLRMVNLDAATGLEAGAVFLIGAEDLSAAHAIDHPPATGEAAAEREEKARKLYMAMTRAAQSLVLLSTEPVSQTLGLTPA